ncbi:NnrS family protein [Devosia sp.]|uniref:NnrS family protein n=1 Tax=Devosia sp. TaxID=1871048 RepID=UPI0025FC191B|nr:NnrS family protein [Devosia sp.]MCR6636813.1 NnrS family protein [Devosia sp.]
MTQDTLPRRKPVPRGLAHSGPVLLSYGFRPFFLAAGVWAVLAMALWILALMADLPIGGLYGGPAWHAHEMLFGYSTAALAGFLLTAIPNWTGRLPVSGAPLALLFAVWLAGRAALIAPDMIDITLAVAIDALFLPLLLVICAREIIAGRKWRDLKILAAVAALASANAGYHVLVLKAEDPGLANRLAVAAFIMLIGIIGGRIIPSFTRNWLAKREAKTLPTPYNHFDTLSLVVACLALAAWVSIPDHPATSAAALVAGVLNTIRLARWQGWQTSAERLVLVLHFAYAFVPLGFFIIALVPFGLFDPISALHVFTVGGIGLMTLAVMSRATRGHTGTPLTASMTTGLSYLCLLLGAILRPLATLAPDHYMTLVSLSGLCWMLAFGLYVLEYAPILLTKRKPRPE